MRFALRTMGVLAAACGGVPQSTSTDAQADAMASTDAVASVSCASLSAPEAAAARDAVFHTLTANSWSSGSPSTSITVIELRADGRYTYTVNSDVPERTDAGSWNFALDGAQSGLLCLDGASASPAETGAAPNLPSALRFTIDSGRFSGMLPGAALPQMGSASSLPDVRLPAGFARLAGRAWEKTNAFDLFMEADAFTVDAAGNFTADYRGGACSQTGVIGWDKDSVLTNSGPNQCDTRGPSPAIFLGGNQIAEFVGDDLVLFESSYRPAGTGTRNEFFFDPYSNSLRVHGIFDGALRAGAATSIDVDYENRDPRQTRTLQRLAASIVPLTATANGFAQAGAPVTLVDRPYTGVILPPGGTFADTIAITPPSAGNTFSLTFTLDYVDPTQSFNGSHSYVTAIAQ